MDVASSLASLHSGTVIFETTVWSLVGSDHTRTLTHADLADAELRADLIALFENASARWRRLGNEYPGTERLWTDLARRAQATATSLAK